MNIILKQLHKKRIDAQILQYPYTFYAYGSRVTGTAHEMSDLDLCILDPLPLNIFAEIKETFHTLPLPFSVDLVQWNRLSKEFQTIIGKDLVRYIPDPLLGAQIIDLSYPLNNKTPVWPGGRIAITTSNDYDNVFRVQQYTLSAGLGTHIDTPAHIVPGGTDLTSLSTLSEMAPCSIFYPTEHITPNFILTQMMLEQYEQKYGTIPQDSWFLIMTGWGKHGYDQTAYRNAGPQGIMHFPTISTEAAQYFIHRKIRGIGIDTLSPDACTSDWPIHRLLLTANILIVENIMYKESLRPQGFLQIIPLAITGGVESPVRALFIQQVV